MYSLLAPLYNDEDETDDGVKTSERTNLTCADLLPPNIIEATLCTLKLCLNGKENLQEIIAHKLRKDLILLDRLSKDVPRKSRFVELVAERLLKYQNTVPIIINKVQNKTNVLPFYKGIDSTGAGLSSSLKSSILTKKFLDLFYELFER